MSNILGIIGRSLMIVVIVFSSFQNVQVVYVDSDLLGADTAAETHQDDDEYWGRRTEAGEPPKSRVPRQSPRPDSPRPEPPDDEPSDPQPSEDQLKHASVTVSSEEVAVERAHLPMTPQTDGPQYIIICAFRSGGRIRYSR